MAKSSKRKTKKPNTSDVNVITITIEQLEKLAGRIERKALLDGDYELILQILRSYDYITSMLKEDRVKLKRLKQLLFGAKTESAANVFPEQEDAPNSKGADTPPSDTKTKDSTPKGHGRNGADDYTGAEQVIVEHDKLKAGDSCPKCCEGTLYLIAPKVIVRVSGQPAVAEIRLGNALQSIEAAGRESWDSPSSLDAVGRCGRPRSRIASDSRGFDACGCRMGPFSQR